MKIVYDNIIFSLQRYGGISVVWSNLITRVCKTVSDIIFMEYEGAEDNVCRKDITLPEHTLRKEDARMMKIRRYLNPCTDFVNRSCADEKFIFHSSYYRTSSHPNAINVTTVHDFAYEFFVKNPIIRHLHSFQKFRAIRKSDKIVCISENTRRDLLRLLPDVDPSRVCVIYNGIDKIFYKQDEAEILLKQVINECKDFSNRNIILGKATFMLGGIEMETERFQLAIQHLEQGYELCIVSSTVEAKSYAYLCAYKLSNLFSNQIPDDEKAALWKQRADGLESQITQ